RELLLRRRALREAEDPGHLGQPPQGEARERAEAADRRGAQPARGGQAPQGPVGTGVRAVGVHADVIVVTSQFWQTTCTAVRPGRCGIGDRELELHPADGHTADGMAVWVPWAGCLVVGDYLSPVEIPMLSPGGSIAAYEGTLARLEPLVTGAETVVPGHGGPIPRDRAVALLAEDRGYLAALRERRADAPLP